MGPPAELTNLLRDADDTIRDAIAHLHKNGIEYQLNEWVMIREYCRRFGIENTSVVSNWITWGVIPPENVLDLPELDDMRLIKAVTYR